MLNPMRDKNSKARTGGKKGRRLRPQLSSRSWNVKVRQKNKSLTYNVLPPCNGGIFRAYRLTVLCIRSCAPTQISIQILGTLGDTL